MRIALTLLALAVGLSGCGLGGDDVSAKDREEEVVGTVDEALPLARDAVRASETDIAGSWSGCPGGAGHRFSGGGTLTAPEGDPVTALADLKEALTGAGFEDVTKVDRHVSVTRGDVSLDFRAPGARDPRLWTVSFQGPCRTYSGDDGAYVKEQRRTQWRSST